MTLTAVPPLTTEQVEPVEAVQPTLPTPGTLLSRCTLADDLGCWVWVDGGATERADEQGEPIFVPLGVLAGMTNTANLRRVAWQLAYGEDVPLGSYIELECGREACLRPTHLRVLPKAHVPIFRAAHPEPEFRSTRRLACAVCEKPLDDHELMGNCYQLTKLRSRNMTMTEPRRLSQ
jgi:hypothetical protein